MFCEHLGAVMPAAREGLGCMVLFQSPLSPLGVNSVCGTGFLERRRLGVRNRVPSTAPWSESSVCGTGFLERRLWVSHGPPRSAEQCSLNVGLLGNWNATMGRERRWWVILEVVPCRKLPLPPLFVARLGTRCSKQSFSQRRPPSECGSACGTGSLATSPSCQRTIRGSST